MGDGGACVSLSLSLSLSLCLDAHVSGGCLTGHGHGYGCTQTCMHACRGLAGHVYGYACMSEHVLIHGHAFRGTAGRVHGLIYAHIHTRGGRGMWLAACNGCMYPYAGCWWWRMCWGMQQHTEPWRGVRMGTCVCIQGMDRHMHGYGIHLHAMCAYVVRG